MNKLEHYDYFENEKSQVLTLPYVNEDFSFLMLLPKER